MRHLDLFAGIGGFSLAASWMGWETVAQVEWDAYCQKVLAKNFPDTLRFGDIVEFNKMLNNGEITWNTEGARKTEIREVFTERSGDKESPNTIGINTIANTGTKRLSLGHIDIITGGFPCQPFSHAGKRKGTNDSRYLWPEMLTTIRILKPSFVVGENVAGLVSMENGKTLDGILSDLANEGYQTEQFIIPACGVGAWHRRDRIWIIANSLHNGNKNRMDTRTNTKKATGSQVRNTKERKALDEQRVWIKSQSGNKAITNSISQRGCSREAGGEYAEDVRQQPGGEEHGYWDFEPSVGRVANGIPNRVDRLKGLGNAIVPQVVYQIFKAIQQINES